MPKAVMVFDYGLNLGDEGLTDGHGVGRIVREDEAIVKRPKRMLLGQRLGICRVQDGILDGLALKSFGHGICLDNLTTSHVDDAGVRLEVRDDLLTDQVLSLLVQCTHRYKYVALASQFIETRDILQIELGLEVEVARARVVDYARFRGDLANLLYQRLRDQTEPDDGDRRRCQRFALAIPVKIPARARERNAKLVKGISQTDDDEREAILDDVRCDGIATRVLHHDSIL
mmetsp:Transcript_31260/g.70733  ORF Transcript_31260/g.70733 Transcript_31260/m.70733 type:complete len:230 (-) Transcript_31260:1358-2047(-)